MPVCVEADVKRRHDAAWSYAWLWDNQQQRKWPQQQCQCYQQQRQFLVWELVIKQGPNRSHRGRCGESLAPMTVLTLHRLEA